MYLAFTKKSLQALMLYYYKGPLYIFHADLSYKSYKNPIGPVVVLAFHEKSSTLNIFSEAYFGKQPSTIQSLHIQERKHVY